MLERAFLARSPRLYMMTPQETAQYGQVLRVSVARLSLNSRTSASAVLGEKPSRARLDPARVAPVIVRNSRRVTSAMAYPSCMSADARSLYSLLGAGQQGTDRRIQTYLLGFALPQLKRQPRRCSSL